MITAGALVHRKARVRLKNLGPGLFLAGDVLCLMTEYGSPVNGGDAYIVSTGEAFWGGAKTPEERGDLLVTPVRIEL